MCITSFHTTFTITNYMGIFITFIFYIIFTLNVLIIWRGSCKTTFCMRWFSISFCSLSFCMRSYSTGNCITAFCVGTYAFSDWIISFCVGSLPLSFCSLSFCMRTPSTSSCILTFCTRTFSWRFNGFPNSNAIFSYSCPLLSYSYSYYQ